MNATTSYNNNLKIKLKYNYTSNWEHFSRIVQVHTKGVSSHESA